MSGKFYPTIGSLLFSIFSLPLFSQSFNLLKDINPGVAGSSYLNFTLVNSTVFFRPDDGVHGDELWKSNGTATGTVLVKDINPGAFGSDLQELTSVNGVIYFRADDGEHGSELWKSDGTEAGTVLIKDIQAGPNGGVLSTLFAANGVLYFQADDGINGTELWKSDGTAAGTVMVKDLYPGVITGGSAEDIPHSSNPNNFTLVNGVVYFTASTGLDTHEIWKTDGTAAGTLLVKDIYSGEQGYTLTNLVNFNGNLCFTVYTGIGNELWKTDGTSAGTQLIKTLTGTNFSNHAAMMNGALYFLESDGFWKSDGTDAGTVLLKENTGSFAFSPEMLMVINGLVYFTGNDADHGLELWKSDGTPSGTVLVKDIYVGPTSSDMNSFAKVGNKLVFTANDGLSGGELWISDGTAAGTKMIQDIEPGSESSFPGAFYEIRGAIIEGAGKIFAAATTASQGMEVWAANVIADAPLPVELLEFKGTLTGNYGLLQWRTEHEANTSAYILERSIDAVNYSSIATTLAQNTSGIHDYSYTDHNIAALGVPVIYYKLRMVDIDGKFKYSNIVALSVDQQKTTIRLYPNPIQGPVNLVITSSQAEKFYWRFTDNIGRTIKAGTYSITSGVNYISEPMGYISPGVYYMQLFNGKDLKQVIRIVKE